jgi:hypothetical protein
VSALCRSRALATDGATLSLSHTHTHIRTFSLSRLSPQDVAFVFSVKFVIRRLAFAQPSSHSRTLKHSATFMPCCLVRKSVSTPTPPTPPSTDRPRSLNRPISYWPATRGCCLPRTLCCAVLCCAVLCCVFCAVLWACGSQPFLSLAPGERTTERRLHSQVRHRQQTATWITRPHISRTVTHTHRPRRPA